MRSLLAIICGILTLSLYGEERRAKEIPVAFLFSDTQPFGLQEVGASASAALEDTLKLKVTMKSTKETVEDSQWTFHSVDSIGKEVKSRSPSVPSLVTEGQYVFVTYSLENLQKAPASIPWVSVMDDKGRAFLPMDHRDARKYLPEEYANLEMNLPSNLKKKICSIYELPKGSRPVAMEVMPLCTTEYHKYFVHNGFAGKKIHLSSAENDVFALTNNVESVKKPTSLQSEKPFMLTMKCTRTENTEEKIGRSFTVRTLGYTVELKVLNIPKKDVSVKAYFIGESGKKLMIAEIVDKEAEVLSTKASSFKVACQPVGENEKFDAGLELKGVIIQAWADGKLMQSYTSQYAWKKYAEMPDLITKFETYTRPHPPGKPPMRGFGK